MGETSKVNIINPETDEDFFAIGRLLLNRSTCLKTQTVALITEGKKIVSWGVNMCCPQGQVYGLPVTECPRVNRETGSYYELCKPIHAEIVAAINAFGISHVEQKSLWHFPGFTLKLVCFQDFFKHRSAKLYLLGHYWACQECVDFLKMIGITEIKFDDLSGGKTLKEYRVKDLTGVDHALDVSGCIVEGIVTVNIRSEDVASFCERHGIDNQAMKPFPGAKYEAEPGFFMVAVPNGTEADRALSFKKDCVVKSASVLLAKTS